MTAYPRIGVGVIIHRNGKLLLGKRRGSHGEGCWQFPGGHLEFGETTEECVAREVLEECGLVVKSVKLGPYTNDIFFEEGKHYITLFAVVECEPGEPEILEPEKCERWEWFSPDQMPSPLFLPIENLMKQGFVLPSG